MKIIGFILVVLSTSLLGFFMGYTEKKRLAALESWQQNIILLQSEIIYNRRPLPEAAKIIAGKTNIFKSFYQELSENLLKSEAGSLPDIWAETVYKNMELMGLLSGDLEKMAAMGGVLGEMNDEIQERVLNRELETWQQAIDAVKEKLNDNQKLYKTLGVLSGILIGTLFI